MYRRFQNRRTVRAEFASEIKELLQTQDVSAELSSKLEQIVKELDSIRQEIPKENEKNSSNKK